MATVTVYWKAADSLLQGELVREGKADARQRWFRVDLEPMTPEQRQAMLALAPMHIDHRGEPYLEDLHLDRRWATLPKPDYHGQWYEWQDVILDHQPELAEVLAMGAERRAAREEALAFQAAKEAEAAEAKRAFEEALAAEYAAIDALEKAGDLAGLQAWRSALDLSITDNRMWELTTARDKAIEGLKAKGREAERRMWIGEHGSAHLKRAHGEGYDCQRLYVLERAGLEAPDFVVDFYQGAEWRERSCPTVAALDAGDAARELGLGEPVIVWLTSEPKPTKVEDEYGELEEPFEPCEAVVLRDYLGKYDLVRVI